jgi:hypothetical protein
MSSNFACTNTVLEAQNGDQSIQGGRSDPCWGSSECSHAAGCMWQQWVPNVHGVETFGGSVPKLIHPGRDPTITEEERQATYTATLTTKPVREYRLIAMRPCSRLL